MATQPPNAPPGRSTWQKIKAGWQEFKETAGTMWKGFRDSFVGYIPYIPKALVISTIVLGGLMLAGPWLAANYPAIDGFIGASALGWRSVFAARLGLGLLLGAVLSGTTGAFEALTKDTGTTAPVTAANAIRQAAGDAPKIQSGIEPNLPHNLPPPKLAANKQIPGLR